MAVHDLSARSISKQLTKAIDKPRDYQREDIGKLKVACDLVARVIYVAFMGTGKTVVASAVVREWVSQGERVLILGHRYEIIKQTQRKLLAAGLPVSMIARHRRRDGIDYGINLDAQIHLASIDTLRRRGVIPGITRIIVDEAHHVPSASWSKLLARYPNARILGLTATPGRLDGKPLGEHFDRMVLQSEAVEALVEDGWLAKPDIWTREDGWKPDVKGLKKKDGDYSRQDAERVMSTIVGGIPAHWKKHANGVPTVLFAATENQIDDIIGQFERAGVKSDKILGYHDDDARDAKLAALASGKVKVLCTCDVLGEGWDFPAARCAVLAAPTASLRRYLQWCGRVMRPGTPPVILDHAGNFAAHGPPWAAQDWDLHTKPSATKHAAVVDREGRVTFREPVEVDGKLVRADESERQTVCAGFGESPCPKESKPNRHTFGPRRVRERHGEPWRCKSCSHADRAFKRYGTEFPDSTQTVCAGFGEMPCPTSARPQRHCFLPGNVKARDGQPWRCRTCSASHRARRWEWQSRCAGPSLEPWSTSCPDDARPKFDAVKPSATKSREGRPWRCMACNAKRVAADPATRERGRRGARAAWTTHRKATVDGLKRLGASKRMPRVPCSYCGADSTSDGSSNVRNGRQKLAFCSREHSQSFLREHPELRREWARRSVSARTPAQRSESSRKASAARTPEQRSEAARKAAATRRAHRRLDVPAPSPAGAGAPRSAPPQKPRAA